MKTFRANKNFTPKSVDSKFNDVVIVLADTDYEIVDTNQAGELLNGIFIKIHFPYIINGVHHKNFHISAEEVAEYGMVQSRLTLKEVKDILDNIDLSGSCVDFKWKWEITEVTGMGYDESVQGHQINGFLINTTFSRPDVVTKIIGVGRGRRMWIEDTASETSVVMTAKICVDLIVTHELMETFRYKNAKILNPHKNVSQLAYPEKLKL